VIRVWDIADPENPVIYDDRDGPNHLQVVFSPEGKLLALRQKYEIWDMASNKRVKKLLRDGEAVISEGSNAIVVWDGDRTTKVWHLPTASLLAERRDLFKLENPILRVELVGSARSCFLIQMDVPNDRFLVHELISEKEQSYATETCWQNSTVALTDEIIALGVHNLINRSPTKPWWNWFAQVLGIHADLSKHYVKLKAFPSGEELCVLKDCRDPIFSPDGRTLAVTSADGKSLQLWDLPIRKPIGKILGFAVLAAVATLLAFNTLGWLRRRRMRLEANLAPNSVPSTK
jgi:WD40 repeat protein